MSPERLRTFLAVVELGTVSAAARALYVAQPALSRRLRALEAETRLTLFRTEHGRLVLTAAGQSFVPIARTMLNAHEQAARSAADLRSGRLGQVTAAATRATIRGMLERFIAQATPPDPAVLTVEYTPDTIERSFAEGADLAIVPFTPSPALAHLYLGEVTVRAQLCHDDPWAGLSEISLRKLAKRRLLLPSTRSATRGVIDAALRHEKIHPTDVLESDDGGTLFSLVVAGHGVALTTERAQVSGLVELPIRSRYPLHLPLFAAWEQDHYAAGALRALSTKMRPLLG